MPSPGKQFRLVLLVVGFVAGTASCRTGSPGEDAGVTEMRHHNWWNFYQRGVALMATGDTTRAREDFERCLGLRSGATYAFPKDLWRARTYGLHFQEQYFPHRELGVCFYILGDDTQAIRWLTASLSQTASGRAKYYLNLARKRSLEGSRAAAPVVRVDAASQAVWTRERNRTLSGTAAGSGYVSEINIGGLPQFIELAATNMSFSRTIALREGPNEIPISVSDLAGNHVATSHTWIADWRPPRLVIRRAAKHGVEWSLSGACTDDRRLARVTVRNTRTAATVLDQEDPGPSLPFALKFADGESLLLEAVDAAGNTLTTEVSASLLARVASATACERYASADGAGMPDVPVSSGSSSTPDDQPPEIRLNVPDSIRVYSEELVLVGSVSDAGGLDSVTVKDEETLSVDDRGALTCGFALRIPLNPGTNTVVVNARDPTGHVTSHTVIAIRKVPDYLDRHFRLSLLLTPFLCRPEDGSSLGLTIRRQTETELTRDPARFFLVERAEGWDLILREQRLAVSDLADPRAVLQLGNVLPAELLLIGSILPIGTGTTIYAVIADAETGETLANDDVYSEDLHRDMEEKVSGLVAKLEQKFPLIDGRVTSTQNGRATINVGSRQGVLSGSRFLVIHPSSGTTPIEESELRTLSDTLVQLRVHALQDSSGAAEIRPKEGRELVASGDYIYAR